MSGPKVSSPGQERRLLDSYPLPSRPWEERRNENRQAEERYPSASTSRYYHDDRERGMGRRRSRSPGADGSGAGGSKGGRSPMTPGAISRQRRTSLSHDSSRPEPGEIGCSPSYNYPPRSGSPSRTGRRNSESDHPPPARSTGGNYGYGYGRGSINGTSASSRNSSPDKDGRTRRGGSPISGETTLRFVRMMKYCLLAETKKQSIQAHFDRLASFPIPADSPALIDARRQLRDAEDDARNCLDDLDDAWNRATRGEREVRRPGMAEERDLRDLVQRVRELERGVSRDPKGKGREEPAADITRPHVPSTVASAQPADADEGGPTDMNIDHDTDSPRPPTAPHISPNKRQRKLLTLRAKLDDYLARVEDLEDANIGFEDRFNELENWVHLREGEDMDKRPVRARTWEELEERRDPRGRLRGLDRGPVGGEAPESSDGTRLAIETAEERGSPSRGIPPVAEISTVSETNDTESVRRLQAQTDLIRSLEVQVKTLSAAVEALRSERATKEDEEKRAMAVYMKQECEAQVKKAIEQAISTMKKSKPTAGPPSASNNGTQPSKSASPAVQSVSLQPIPEASVPPRPASSSGAQPSRPNDIPARPFPPHLSPSLLSAQVPNLSRSSPSLQPASTSAAGENAKNILLVIRSTLEAYRRQGYTMQDALKFLIPPDQSILNALSESARDSLYAMVEAHVRVDPPSMGQPGWGVGQNGMHYQVQGQQGGFGDGSHGQVWGGGMHNGGGQYYQS